MFQIEDVPDICSMGKFQDKISISARALVTEIICRENPGRLQPT